MFVFERGEQFILLIRIKGYWASRLTAINIIETFKFYNYGYLYWYELKIRTNTI